MEHEISFDLAQANEPFDGLWFEAMILSEIG